MSVHCGRAIPEVHLVVNLHQTCNTLLSSMASLEVQKPWLMLAILSGACAAFNGVFAKLTTTSLTTSLAKSIASTLRISSSSMATEFAIRVLFFVLNMTFNGVMWGLFTRALALSPSTIRVNVINTASNFLVTAVMGYLIFGEHLPPLWFLGASMLVGGSVIIGGRDNDVQKSKSDTSEKDIGGKVQDSGSSTGPPDSGTSASQTASGGEVRERKRRTGNTSI